MTRDEVVDLLTTIAHYDKRLPDAETVAAWSMSAHLAKWSFPLAVAAVHEHFAFSTEYLKPGRITALINRKPVPQGPPPLAIALPAHDEPPAEPERVRGLIEQVAAKLGWQRTPEKASAAASSPVGCPNCHALPGKPCVRQVFRGPHRGRFVPLSQPHWSRVELEKGRNPFAPDAGNES